ncbi:MAG: DUF2281 domain-containing protein [Bacteroidetes bacterium]|nr:DUF2281 domain-containing protein [Bacteroidota bacterium]
MATEQLFFQKFSLLTAEQKAAVLLVIETFLGAKSQKQNKFPEPTPAKKRRAYGSLKGKISMAPDFDAPLEEMKEYMY